MTRIYLVGAHSTGKTTLARYINHRYKLPMIAEVARQVLAEMELTLESLRTDIEQVGVYQREVMLRQISNERAQQGGFVSDRAFDNLAYAAEHSMISSDLFQTKELTEYMRWVAEGYVFFIRPQPTIMKDDGVRERANWDAVIRIDGMIKILLEQFGVPYLPINTASHQERVRAIEFVMRLVGDGHGRRSDARNDLQGSGSAR